MDIMSSLGAIFSGGATGILGSAVSGYFDLKKSKLLYSHERDKFKHEEVLEKLAMDVVKLEVEGKAKIAGTQADAAKEIVASEVFDTSLKSDKSSYSTGLDFTRTKGGFIYAGAMVFVDFVRGTLRPVITYYLVILVSIMYFNFMKEIGVVKETNPEMIAEYLDRIVLVLLYVSTSVILWWFGSRQSSKITDRILNEKKLVV